MKNDKISTVLIYCLMAFSFFSITNCKKTPNPNSFLPNSGIGRWTFNTNTPNFETELQSQGIGVEPYDLERAKEIIRKILHDEDDNMNSYIRGKYLFDDIEKVNVDLIDIEKFFSDESLLPNFEKATGDLTNGLIVPQAQIGVETDDPDHTKEIESKLGFNENIKLLGIDSSTEELSGEGSLFWDNGK
jgi:hypothetical protein